MGQLVDLAKYRGSPVEIKRSCPDAPRFFCLACDTDAFKLYESGAVHCRNCGALIRNLRIWDK